MVAVAGLTMDPFGYPVIYLYWLLLGAALQSEVTVRLSARQRSRAMAADPGSLGSAGSANATPR